MPVCARFSAPRERWKKNLAVLCLRSSSCRARIAILSRSTPHGRDGRDWRRGSLAEDRHRAALGGGRRRESAVDGGRRALNEVPAASHEWLSTRVSRRRLVVGGILITVVLMLGAPSAGPLIKEFKWDPLTATGPLRAELRGTDGGDHASCHRRGAGRDRWDYVRHECARDPGSVGRGTWDSMGRVTTLRCVVLFAATDHALTPAADRC